MSVRGDKAYELFLSGYNCTQAVVGAFADVIGMDFDTAVRFSSGFGGGMGRLREVCGTFSGAVIVVNALYGYSDPKNVQANSIPLYRSLGLSSAGTTAALSARSCSGFPDRKARQYRKQERTSITRSVPVRSFADIQRTCLRSTSGNTLR